MGGRAKNEPHFTGIEADFPVHHFYQSVIKNLTDFRRNSMETDGNR
jgi:hypothetical protein